MHLFSKLYKIMYMLTRFKYFLSHDKDANFEVDVVCGVDCDVSVMGSILTNEAF